VPGWEVAQLLGAGAVIGCLLLCALPVRPRAHTTRPLSLGRHELVGWLTLAAAALHVALLPVVDARVIEHFKLTTPLYEWAGMLALLMLLWLTLPSIKAIRQRLWSRHRTFQALHVGTTCVLILCVAVHVVTTNRYVHGRVRVIAYLALSAMALLALLRARAPALATAHKVLPHRLVFGKNSATILGLVVLALLAMPALLAGGVRLKLRQAVVARTEPLAVDFPHEKHRAVNCIVCHHNFVDGTGADECYSCHRHSPAIKVSIEARFHDFCLGCHRDPPAGLRRHGPVDGCQTCHVVGASARGGTV
jgi:predicted CXXCH cytochrome family protein